MATMSVTEMLQWARQRQYPGLVLGPGQIVRRSERAWQQLRHATPEQLALVAQRIERWNAIEQKARAS